jgi:salicylate hydroxylase
MAYNPGDADCPSKYYNADELPM